MNPTRDEIEALRAEVRRLLSVVRRLEEEKRDHEERLAFLAMELERLPNMRVDASKPASSVTTRALSTSVTHVTPQQLVLRCRRRATAA
jgi:hypothetical protein